MGSHIYTTERDGHLLRRGSNLHIWPPTLLSAPRLVLRCNYGPWPCTWYLVSMYMGNCVPVYSLSIVNSTTIRPLRWRPAFHTASHQILPSGMPSILHRLQRYSSVGVESSALASATATIVCVCLRLRLFTRCDGDCVCDLCSWYAHTYI